MNYRNVGLLAVGHLVTDVNQGALPAILPFLMAQHHLTYQAVAGLIFALNVSSSIAQPLFGLYSDRMSRPWLMPIGIFLAGAGLAMVGFLSEYWSWFTVVAFSGVGIAAFHPDAARLTNLLAGEKKTTAMSVFGIGGTIGIALGPIFSTFFLVRFGLKGTLALVFPVSLMAVLSMKKLIFLSSSSSQAKGGGSGNPSETDEWRPFFLLTALVICRSVVFYALNTFVPLYWVDLYKQSKASGATALTIFLSAGIAGHLLGGRLADRYGQRAMIKVAFGSLFLVLLPFAMKPDITFSTLLLIPIGMATALSYSPMVVMGQSFLPGRVALSSGITLGLTVSAGGMFVPLLGRLADSHGLGAVLWATTAVPVLATLLACSLPLPQIDK